MAALGALIAGDLPPAGHPILWRPGAAPPQFPGYRTLWVNSGTAALALAMTLARRARPAAVAPEVVLPAYACPDLVAAAQFAGVKAVLADIGGDDPAYDARALAGALSANTVAVVAINFLGIRERFDVLREVLGGTSVALIEDDAQWFPEPLPALNGDLVCLSFGRGKPVSLLGGGVLLVREGAVESREDVAMEPMRPSGAAYRLKVGLYNRLLAPPLYRWLNRNPLLPLGRTVYKPLTGVFALDAVRLALLGANVECYLQRSRAVEERIRALIAAAGLVQGDIAAAAGERSGRLLRYPLLCRDHFERDYLWSRLHAAGLGATSLYRRELPAVEGVAGRVEVRGGIPGATAFAGRLLTLPVHAGVTPAHLARMREVLSEAGRR